MGVQSKAIEWNDPLSKEKIHVSATSPRTRLHGLRNQVRAELAKCKAGYQRVVAVTNRKTYTCGNGFAISLLKQSSGRAQTNSSSFLIN